MPYFFYKSKNKNNETESGFLNASNEKELAKILRKQGKFLIWTESEEQSLKKKNNIFSFFQKVSLLEKIMFSRNLQVMVSTGVPLPRALDILTAQAQSKRFKKIIQNLKKNIIQGKPLSFALKQHPIVFPEVFSNIILAGEESGSMAESLEVLTEQLEKEYDLKSKIKGALIYPAVIIAAMTVIGSLMIIIVIPMIAKTFEQLEAELPLITKIIIAFGLFFSRYWYLFIILFLGFIILIRFFLKTKLGKRIKDKILLKIPFFANLIKKINLAHFCRTLSSLMSSGVSLSKSLQLVSFSFNNVFYQEAVQNSKQQVEQGAKLSNTLDKNIFPILVTQMVEVGEETGETVVLLKKLADFYEQEVSNITKNMATLIEPLLMLLIGLAVGLFAISIIQPIYSMLGSI